MVDLGYQIIGGIAGLKAKAQAGAQRHHGEEIRHHPAQHPLVVDKGDRRGIILAVDQHVHHRMVGDPRFLLVGKDQRLGSLRNIDPIGLPAAIKIQLFLFGYRADGGVNQLVELRVILAQGEPHFTVGQPREALDMNIV
ncbi:hypothetical protein [Enterobacter cloacae]|uniref:hypothetical protein n=1 Tax=Enterobacter cloacae TaxID=550 RepID=UPI0032AE9ADF